MSFPKVYMAVDSNHDANIVIDFSANVGGSVAFTIDEDAALALRDKLNTYLNVQMQDFKEFWNANRKPSGCLCTWSSERELTMDGMRSLFEELADDGRKFYVVFEKQDGSLRQMNARVLNPVKYSYRTRTSYADVIDCDMWDSNWARKIVIQRVQFVVLNDTRYTLGR